MAAGAFSTLKKINSSEMIGSGKSRPLGEVANLLGLIQIWLEYLGSDCSLTALAYPERFSIVERVSLTKTTWEYDVDDPLGPAGGFGAVFRGRGEDGPVAVKRLHLKVGVAG